MTRSKRKNKKATDVAHSTDSQVMLFNPGSSKLKIRRSRLSSSSVTSKVRKTYSEPLSYPTSLHICHECNVAYENAKSLTIHMSRYHNKKSGEKCPECPRMLSSKFSISKHLLTHRPRSEWPAQCPLCFKRFQAVTDVPKHFATSVHRGDPRIPEYQSKEWTELLKKCKVKASKPTNCTSKRKSSVLTLSKNVPCVSNIQVSKPKATAENHFEQNDDSSKKKEKASVGSSQNLPVKKAQIIPSSTSSASIGKPLSNSSQDSLIHDTFFHDHPHSVGPNLNMTPEPLFSEPQIVNSSHTLKTYGSKKSPPKILPKLKPEASSSMAPPQSTSQILPSYKLVKILGQNSTVIKQLLVPSNAQIYNVRKPCRNVFPTLSNIPVNSQNDFKKQIHPTLSNTPVEKQTVKLQFTTPSFSKTSDYSGVPVEVEKIAFLSNEVINPLDL